MTVDTQHLRELIAGSTPGPVVLATSNSWRRIESVRCGPICVPCTQPDGHPDLYFRNGGASGPDAVRLIEGYNALPSLLDHIDAQAAEIERKDAEVARLRAERDRLLRACHTALLWSDQDWVGHEEVSAAVQESARDALSGERNG